jgi:hypothetical protein
LIDREQEYLDFIIRQGVGRIDRAGSSPKSYISYLNCASKLIGEAISLRSVSNENDVLDIADRLKGKRAPGTIRNIKSAMRQYVAMLRTNS